MTQPTGIIQPGVVIIFSDNQSVLNSTDEKLVGNEGKAECLIKFSISHGQETFFRKVIFTVLISANAIS